jgi:tetratricopeptide (TPR) repeat protein
MKLQIDSAMREPSLCADVAGSLEGKGVALAALGRFAEAISTYDRVIDRFADTVDPTILETVAKARRHKGLALARLDQIDEAVRTWDDLAVRFGDAPARAVRAELARALVDKDAPELGT